MSDSTTCKSLYKDSETPASDLIKPPTTKNYASMTVDLFDKYNLLLTNPSGEKSQYSGAGYSGVANVITTRAALKWSNALSLAILEYINY